MKSTHVSRLVCVALLVVPLGSCFKYQPITVDPRQYFESEPGRSRVTTLGGVKMVLHHPEMADDSVASRGEGRCRFDMETSSRCA